MKTLFTMALSLLLVCSVFLAYGFPKENVEVSNPSSSMIIEEDDIQVNKIECQKSKCCAVVVEDVMVEEELDSEAVLEENDGNENDVKYEVDHDDLYVLSHVIYAEAGGHSEELQRYVGSVVLNRVGDDRFPDTIEGVVFQKGQYSCTWNGAYHKEPSETSVAIAEELLLNGSLLPSYVIFQSGSRQGDSTYLEQEGTYFCYWSSDVQK